jgi:HKD family nuclease
MDVDFHIQDPMHPGTTYLYEAILDAAVHAAYWRGIYAFASRNGVDQLIEDPIIHDFLKRGGKIDLIVGIDAVTNRQTLERLQDLERLHPLFRPRVFWNGTHGLFHPKISQFSYADGKQKMIVGSGNLTPGGLMHNFEGYTVISGIAGEDIGLTTLDEFLKRQAANIRVIDTAALERAARNIVRPIQGTRRPKPKPPAVPPAVPTPRPAIPTIPTFDRILISEVPKAGDRWAQVHFNAAVVSTYFRITNLKTQRVYLTRVKATGDRGDEEVRPCVYAVSNKNHKIEIAAAKGLVYPPSGHPILVFRERQVRCFDYMLLMPRDKGYTEIKTLMGILPKVGRGFNRVITDIKKLEGAWPSCPLLKIDPESEKEI